MKTNSVTAFLGTQKIAVTVSLFLGLVIARSAYNHLGFWQLSLPVKAAVVGFLILSGTLLSYLLVFRFAWQRLQNYSVKTRIACILICTAGGALLLFTLPINVPVPTPARTLEIVAGGGKNPASDGSQVWLMEVRDVNGHLVPSGALEKAGEWETVDGMLVSRGQQPASLRYSYKASGGGEMTLLFAARPDAGKAAVYLDGQEKIVDLYEASSSKTLVFMPVATLDVLPVIFLHTVDMVTLALFVLVIVVLFTAWFARSPKTALGSLALLGALSLSGAAINPRIPNHKDIWLLVAALNIITALVIQKKYGAVQPVGKFGQLRSRRQDNSSNSSIGFSRYLYFVFLSALAAGYILISSWNVFFVAPDSYSYVKQDTSGRPPVYPLFVKATTAGTDFNHSIGGMALDTPIEDTGHPLTRTANAQKIVLFASAVLACFAAASALDTASLPVTAAFFLWLFHAGYFTTEINYIMSETLAQAWTFLLMAALFAFIRWRKGWLLPAAGLCFAGLYLTRSAGVYGSTLFGAAILWALIVDRRRYWHFAAAAVAVVLVMAAIPSLSFYIKTQNAAPTAQYSSTRMPFALQLAEPGDIEHMPDEMTQIFLERALEKKAVQDAYLKDKYPDSEYMQYTFMLNHNLYQVAYPVLREMSADPAEQEAIMSTASETLLQRHSGEYYRMGGMALRMATDLVSRIKFEGLNSSFWGIIALVILLCIAVGGWVGLSAAALAAAHLAHIIIIAYFDVPIKRYVYATEFLVWIAIYILAWGATRKFFRRSLFL